jgi:hypothetical protein
MGDSVWRTAEEWEQWAKEKAISAISNWEGLADMPMTHPDEYKAAKREVFWALWPLESSSLVLSGKRYKADKRNGELRVTLVPPKKPRNRKR